MPKIFGWIVCLFISVCGVYKAKKQMKEQERQNQTEEYYRQLLEKQELYRIGLPTPYINGLGENPLLKHFFNKAQRYAEECKFKQAIEEFKKCLSHPQATEENKVAVNILIGNCYYQLCKLKSEEIEKEHGKGELPFNVIPELISYCLSNQMEAERYYKEALKISKRVKNKAERLKSRSIAFRNIGVLSSSPDNALKFLKEALEIDKKIGDQKGIAESLYWIGINYRYLGKLNDALKYFKEALEIIKCIGTQPEIETVLKAINIIEKDDVQNFELLKKDTKRILVEKHCKISRMEVRGFMASFMVKRGKAKYKIILRPWEGGFAIHVLICGFLRPLLRFKITYVVEALELKTHIKDELKRKFKHIHIW